MKGKYTSLIIGVIFLLICGWELVSGKAIYYKRRGPDRGVVTVERNKKADLYWTYLGAKVVFGGILTAYGIYVIRES